VGGEANQSDVDNILLVFCLEFFFVLDRFDMLIGLFIFLWVNFFSVLIQGVLRPFIRVFTVCFAGVCVQVNVIYLCLQQKLRESISSPMIF
jgi:hypothetical protein